MAIGSPNLHAGAKQLMQPPPSGGAGGNKSKVFARLNSAPAGDPNPFRGGAKKQYFLRDLPLRCRHCRSDDDFKIRFCESTPRQPEIRIYSEGGGQKKARFCCALLLPTRPRCALHLGPTPPEILCTSRHHDNKICVVPRLCAQLVIR
jgi:hypothetical protein